MLASNYIVTQDKVIGAVGAVAEKRRSQLLKGVLDMCLLSLISEEPCYGYEMVRKMEERGLALVGEGSIYPLLSRLQGSGYVEGYAVASKGGPGRKYYRVLPAGEERLLAWGDEWRSFARAVDRVVGDGSEEGPERGQEGGPRA